MKLESQGKVKILDFDIENRPLSYWYGSETTAEITAIASCWVDVPSSMEVWLLGVDSLEDMLKAFVARYDEADIVTGHYIRKHDLPHINSALLELGLSQLGPKLTVDTKLDMNKKAGLPASQEYLAELLKLQSPKIGMSQHDWRAANRLTKEGLALTTQRVSGDVIQHMELREKMLERGLLKPPKMWNP